MIDYGFQIEFWHWFALSLVLAIIELGAFGAYFLLCSAVAAFAIGIVLWVFPDLSVDTQIGLWALVSIACIVGWSILRTRLCGTHLQKNDESLLNNRSKRYLGRVIVLETDVVSGVDTQHAIDDGFWTLRSEDDSFTAGDHVKVVDASSVALYIKKV